MSTTAENYPPPFIEGSLAFDGTPVAHDLDMISWELNHYTAKLAAQVGELACQVEDRTIPIDRDEVMRLAVKLAATTHYLSSNAVTVAAVRDKAVKA